MINTEENTKENAGYIEEAYAVISGRFGMSDNPAVKSMIKTNDSHLENEIKKLLSDRIAELLNKNPEKLQNILYRIDVNEQFVNEVFSDKSVIDIPSKLAELVFNRQLQKVKTRRFYSAMNKMIE